VCVCMFVFVFFAPGCGPKTNRNVKQAIKWQHADFAHKLTNRICLGASLSARVLLLPVHLEMEVQTINDCHANQWDQASDLCLFVQSREKVRLLKLTIVRC